MFEDQMLQSLIQAHAIKAFLGLALALAWIVYYRSSLKPYFKKVREATNGEEHSFPAISLVFMLFLTAGWGYYCVMEHTFRDPVGIDAPLVDDNSEAIERERRESADSTSNYQRPADSLDELTDEMIEENRKQNEAGKAEFLENRRIKPDGDKSQD